MTLSTASLYPITVQFATANNTAIAGNDYQSPASTLTFAPGEASKTISILVNGDRRETTKTITITVYGDKRREANDTQTNSPA